MFKRFLLSRAEFSVALKHGRGSASMHILAHGLVGVEDLVLAACLEDQAYDRQCEGHRADWLFGMFKDASTYAHFSDAIVAALDRGDDACYITQVCELASLMGRNGDSAAAAALRAFVWSQPDIGDGISGGHAIVALDGIPAALELARRAGRHLLEHPEDYVDSLDYLTEDTSCFDQAFAEMKRLALADTALAAYFVKQQAELDDAQLSKRKTAEQKDARIKAYQAETLRDYPVEKILAAASDNGTKRRYFYARFGRLACDEDLQRILQRLHVETNPETCKRLLWVFGRGALPRVDDRVWELASGATSELRDAAMMALSFLCDSRVGDLGRQCLRDGRFSADDAAAIALLALNFQAGDEALILAALQRLTVNDDDAHAIASSVEQVCIKNNSPAVTPLLEWIYHTNPCTICRRTAVELLSESGSLSAVIAEECLHDASSQLRALVQTSRLNVPPMKV